MSYYGSIQKKVIMTKAELNTLFRASHAESSYADRLTFKRADATDFSSSDGGTYAEGKAQFLITFLDKVSGETVQHRASYWVILSEDGHADLSAQIRYNQL
ncbi:MAG: hypothetical protein EOP06_00835 [Proteobacteria bacterium]|nr:MAG: hypothetical protein EOP06_00835 [Pseudomonadota bacterium]